MRGRRFLSLAIVIVLLIGTLYVILPQVKAATTNVGIASVAAGPELPQRQEQSPTSVIVTAYNNGTDYTEYTYHVDVYYYVTTVPGTKIDTLEFIQRSSVDVPRNETYKAVTWDISAVPENTYKFYAVITDVPVGDANAFDNSVTSTQTPTPRQQQLGIIAGPSGHNVGIGIVQGGLPLTITAGDPYQITVSAFNNGYVAESFTVTTYYNRSFAPSTLVAINTTTITNMPAKTGSQSWQITWDTTGLLEDTYSLSSNASVVSGETITYEQFDFANDDVRMIQHDIAVLGVIASPTGATAGTTVKVNVTVENQGAVTESSFNVRAKANGTLVASPQLVSSLAPEANTTVTFNWDTTGWPSGFYVLNGSADIVPGETLETVDNVYISYAPQRRVNIPPVHDVATTFVYTNQTFAKPGDHVAIYATIQNQGDADESFTVTAYYDTTQAATPQPVVLTKRANTGEAYHSQVVTFIWDTTGVPLGTYTIKVSAAAVGGETDTADNDYTDGRVVFTKLYMDPSKAIPQVSDTYQVRPTTQTISAISVTSPGNAYDNNAGTYASFTTNPTGYIEFTTFTPPALSTNVAQVDVNIMYSALAVGTDRLRLIQSVSPSATWDTLRDWTGGGTIPTSNYQYADRPEPNDGSWSWGDVGSINVRLEYDEASAVENPNYIRLYEVWATITSDTGTFYSRPTASADPNNIITSDNLAYDLSTTTYAYVTPYADGYFNMQSFNTTAGTGTISRVDLYVRYTASLRADYYRILNSVSPSISLLTLLGNTYSDVNVPLQTYVWSYRPEPNDGNWSWTDVSNMKVRFATTLSNLADNREIRVYEIWLTVYDKPFNVNFNVGGVSSLAAYSARITWDPTVLELVKAEKGGFFVGYSTSFTPSINHASGYADLSETILGTGSTSGTGTLAILTFRMLQTGKSMVSVSTSVLVDEYGALMAHFAEPGKYNTLPLAGDLDGDGDVDAADMAIFNAAYGSRPGDGNWNASCDFNADLIVDAKDLRFVGINWW